VHFRAMTFTVRIVEALVKDPALSFYDALMQAYAATLQPYHGFFTTTAFQVRVAPA
jgi:hypothetical protein